MRAPPAGHTDPHERRFALVATACYLAILMLLVSFHEPWFDELQAWRIAIDSRSLADLVRNLEYEGHPILWYLVLRAAGGISRSWSAAVCVHVLIATASAWLVLRHAPFTRLQRLLVVSGYFFIFEYAVVTRSYALGTLLALAACTVWDGSRRRAWLVGALLILLANTSAVGLVLALAMSMGFSADHLRGRYTHGNANERSLRSMAQVAAIAGVLIVAVVAVTAVQILPPADAAFRGESMGGPSQSLLSVIGRGLTIPARAFVPIAPFRTDGVAAWNSWILEPETRVQVAGTDLISILCFLCGIVATSRRLTAQFFWTVAFGGFLAFFMIFHAGYLHHHGYLVVAFIVAAWMARMGNPDPLLWPRAFGVLRGPRRQSAALTAVLPLMIVGGVQMGAADYATRFADATSVAGTLGAPALSGLPIVGMAYPLSQTVAALLGRPVYLVNEARAGTFVNFGHRVRSTDKERERSADAAVTSALSERCGALILTDERSPPTPWMLQSASPIPLDSSPLIINSSPLRAWLVRRPGAPGCRP